MAFGLLGLRREDFYLMRPGEFWEAVAVKTEYIDADRRHSGELARGMALRLVNIQLKQSDRYTKPSAFWQMPWDETEEEQKEKVRKVLKAKDANEKAKAFLKKIGW